MIDKGINYKNITIRPISSQKEDGAIIAEVRSMLNMHEPHIPLLEKPVDQIAIMQIANKTLLVVEKTPSENAGKTPNIIIGAIIFKDIDRSNKLSTVSMVFSETLSETEACNLSEAMKELIFKRWGIAQITVLVSGDDLKTINAAKCMGFIKEKMPYSIVPNGTKPLIIWRYSITKNGELEKMMGLETSQEKSKSGFQDEIERLKRELLAAKKTISDLKEKKSSSEFENKNKEAVEANEKLSKEIESLKNKLAETESKLNNEIRFLGGRIKSLEEELGKKNKLLKEKSDSIVKQAGYIEELKKSKENKSSDAEPEIQETKPKVVIGQDNATIEHTDEKPEIDANKLEEANTAKPEINEAKKLFLESINSANMPEEMQEIIANEIKRLQLSGKLECKDPCIRRIVEMVLYLESHKKTTRKELGINLRCSSQIINKCIDVLSCLGLIAIEPGTKESSADKGHPQEIIILAVKNKIRQNMPENASSTSKKILTDYDHIVELLKLHGEKGINTARLCQEALETKNIRLETAKAIIRNLDKQQNLIFPAGKDTAELMQNIIAYKI